MKQHDTDNFRPELAIFDEYAVWTDKVAQYPKTAEPQYLALGIADEFGEFAGAISNEAELKEAGDVLWYCARYARLVLALPFSRFFFFAPATDHSSSAGRAAIMHIGVLCGVEKKRIRDGEGWSEEVRKSKHQHALAALQAIVDIVRVNLGVLGYTAEDAVRLNMHKLGARLDAGTIKGDGDNR